MLVADLVPIGWVHAFACIVALASGAWNIAARKGTPVHRAAGIAYMLSMIVANLTVFAIYKFDIASFEPFKAGPNTFGIFHWLAVVTLVFLAIGWYAGARQHNAFWAFVHPAMMVLTYYLLLAGGINEAFLRVEVLRDLAAASPADQYGQPQIIGFTHAWWMAFVLLQLVYFSVRVFAWRWRARSERTQRLGQAAA